MASRSPRTGRGPSPASLRSQVAGRVAPNSHAALGARDVGSDEEARALVTAQGPVHRHGHCGDAGRRALRGREYGDSAETGVEAEAPVVG